jgi:hypothetical protein
MRHHQDSAGNAINRSTGQWPTFSDRSRSKPSLLVILPADRCQLLAFRRDPDTAIVSYHHVNREGLNVQKIVDTCQSCRPTT